MRHSPFTAVYDACVLYPAPLRDFLIWLGLSGRFRASWSAQIHSEWKRNLLQNHPDLSAEQLDRTSALMDQAIPDSLVVGYKAIIPGLVLPDSNDRHVLATAIRCNASVIATFNEKDFPVDARLPTRTIPMQDILQYLKLNGELDSEIAATTRRSLAEVSVAVSELSAQGEVVACGLPWRKSRYGNSYQIQQPEKIVKRRHRKSTNGKRNMSPTILSFNGRRGLLHCIYHFWPRLLGHLLVAALWPYTLC